ncbi:RebB family R body protein [Aliivibrio fischeri]|uniref:Glycerol-3-phosphate dehydrogenase subunit C n=1 Tax=Aliivibrio fischeri SR5 TaxID=1088719 RepID=A0AAV3EP17_ALIFS|nr:RebB family R body protein [Aliivibrio fischeri]EHN68480.1 hypothetical protein VFSR5_A1065 [Aliivibrio fischeri SR5]MUH95649.1 glycerol-3-phosphate dehydrogenase subunit C [Aliivibrio fischeri]MUI64340.1 glycerol-3-phosphate dehydrogenase subunit C [Aliivibrio fischeri]MUJ25257.1 glycerol-3-phosphate dehydrogenase subunit C [Aliivibrio fischeri]MUK25022.1 glycerol-3-phosphate dehydrogenase subunit C [Aliivibrio fischeri]
MANIVNEKTTDSVTQINTESIGGIPSMAMNNFIMAINTAISNGNQNAAISQQQGQMLMQASTTQGINAINAISSASISKATEAILDK